MSSLTRPLLEQGADAFIRHNDALSILKKVMAVENGGRSNTLNLPEDKRFMKLVSPRKPFGLATNVQGQAKAVAQEPVLVYQNGGVGYIDKAAVTAATEVVDEWKVFIGGAHGGHGHGKDIYPTIVISKPFIGEPGSASH